MATLDMTRILAVMPQADCIVTIKGQTFTIPATIPFTTNHDTIDVAAGTVLAVMYDPTAPKGKILQVFSIDDIITVS